MNLSRSSSAAAADPERSVDPLNDRLVSVTSLSMPDDRPVPQISDIADTQAPENSKILQPPEVFVRSAHPASLQLSTTAMPQAMSCDTTPDAPIDTPDDVYSQATPSELEGTSNPSWPPPGARFAGSPVRWSDLVDDSDEDDPQERAVPLQWQTQPHVQTPAESLPSSYSPDTESIPAQSHHQFLSPSPPQPHSLQAAAEPVHTTIGFNLPLGPVPEDSPAPDEQAAVPTIVGFPNSPGCSEPFPSEDPDPATSTGLGSPKSSPLPFDTGLTRRHGYAGALTMLYSAADASNVRSVSGGLGGSKVAQPRVEAVLPVENDERVKAMVRAAAHGFLAAQEPQAPRDGMGGTYFLLNDRGEHACIFKPCDEEPLAPNNPKGWAGRALGAPGLKPCVRVGEAALREVAAYLLDYNGFAGIPPACLVLCRHSKLNYTVRVPRIESMAVLNREGDAQSAFDSVGNNEGNSQAVRTHLVMPALPGGYKLGSLQAFAEHKCDANELSPSVFSADNVHRIGILDIRLLNTDRHAGNLLVSVPAAAGSDAAGSGLSALSSGLRAPYTLVPIDHGFALPEALEGPYFEWMYWAQTSVPFSEEVKAYVAALDAKQDIAMLRERLPALRTECLRCLEVTTLVLKACVAAGLTLFEIASLFSRPSEHVPSDFEALCMDARDNALQAPSYPALRPPSSPGTSPHHPFANPLSPVEDGNSRTSCSSVEHAHDKPSFPFAQTTLDAEADLAVSPAHTATSLGSEAAWGSNGGLPSGRPPAVFTHSSPLRDADAGFMGGALPPAATTADHSTPGGEMHEMSGFSTEMLPPHSPTAPQTYLEGDPISNVPGSPCLSDGYITGGAAATGIGADTGATSAPRPIESSWLRGAPVRPASLSDSPNSPRGARFPQLPAAASFLQADSFSCGPHPANSFGGRMFDSMDGRQYPECSQAGPDRVGNRTPAHGEVASTAGPLLQHSRASTGAHDGVLLSRQGGTASPTFGSSLRHRRRSAWVRKRAAAGGPYRRPVLHAAHPDRASYVFTGISDPQWEVFVESVDDFVREELIKGTWRVQRSSAPVAMSCPDSRKRF